MKIGFDLDGIFIDKPPFIPKTIIERLYVKDMKQLTYRIPSRLEQVIRKAAHYPLFRPPITPNIRLLLRQAKQNIHQYYLVSGRFGFLQSETEHILKKHGLDGIFAIRYINNDNAQPHLFKNTMLKKLAIHRYVDDDLPLLNFLAQNNKKIIFFWLNTNVNKHMQSNLIAISRLAKVFQ